MGARVEREVRQMRRVLGQNRSDTVGAGGNREIPGVALAACLLRQSHHRTARLQVQD